MFTILIECSKALLTPSEKEKQMKNLNQDLYFVQYKNPVSNKLDTYIRLSAVEPTIQNSIVAGKNAYTSYNSRKGGCVPFNKMLCDEVAKYGEDFVKSKMVITKAFDGATKSDKVAVMKALNVLPNINMMSVIN